jgi:4-oxalocrotonate tautomerase
MVSVKVIEGVFTAEQKQEMIRKLTDTMVEIEGGEPPAGHLGPR